MKYLIFLTTQHQFVASKLSCSLAINSKHLSWILYYKLPNANYNCIDCLILLLSLNNVVHIFTVPFFS